MSLSHCTQLALGLVTGTREKPGFAAYAPGRQDVSVFVVVFDDVQSEASLGHLGALWAQRAACSALLPPGLLRDGARPPLTQLLLGGHLRSLQRAAPTERLLSQALCQVLRDQLELGHCRTGLSSIRRKESCVHTLL